MSLGRHNSKCSVEFFHTVPEEHEILFACQPVMNSFHDLPLVSSSKRVKKIWICFLSYDQQRARPLVSNEKYGHIFANLKKQLDSNIWAKYNCKNGCLYEAWSHFRACDHTLYSSTSDSRNIDTWHFPLCHWFPRKRSTSLKPRPNPFKLFRAWSLSQLNFPFWHSSIITRTVQSYN